MRSPLYFVRFALLALVLAALPILWAGRSGPGQPAPATAGTANPGRIVVDLKDDASPQAVADLESRYRLDLALNSVHADEEKLMKAAIDPAQEASVLAALRSEPAVEFAEPERTYTAYFTPDDPRFKEQWNFKLIRAEKAWDIARGKDVVVAVIDTGVAFENDDRCYLAQDFHQTRFVKGYDFIHDDEHPNDDHGHGTHVAGTIAESTDNGEGVAGLAFEARIMPIKVLSRFGTGTNGDIADAIRFAADSGAKVINMSLGSPLPDLIVASACAYAHKKGVVIVCAAGNGGGEGVGFPAAYKECIAVSSVGPTGELAPYSSWGKPVAIAAPGGDKTKGEEYGILQNTVAPTDGYYSFQGTSMASPHVAAAAALAISAGVSDPDEVKAVLQKSARPKSPANQYGAGILDAAAACQEARAASGAGRAKAGLSFLLGLACLGIGQLRRKYGISGGYPVAATAAVILGLLLPGIFGSLVGFGSLLNLLGYSVALPLLLFSAASSRSALGFIAALVSGFIVNFLWEIALGLTPFAAALGWQALIWLATNILVGIGMVIAAVKRGRLAVR
ncbi:MAG: S8 family serine peptidase [Armatimonadetes bacterium]|nr:S8 family serine peptidase [Armatimonadota bacterium]